MHRTSTGSSPTGPATTRAGRFASLRPRRARPTTSFDNFWRRAFDRDARIASAVAASSRSMAVSRWTDCFVGPPGAEPSIWMNWVGGGASSDDHSGPRWGQISVSYPRRRLEARGSFSRASSARGQRPDSRPSRSRRMDVAGAHHLSIDVGLHISRTPVVGRRSRAAAWIREVHPIDRPRS